MTDDIPSRPKFLGLLNWTDAEGWAGKKGREGGASKCPCLDRMKTEDCVKVQFMCLKLRHSAVPFGRELFFPHFNVTLRVAWSSFTTGGHTVPYQGSVVAGSSPLPSDTGERQLQARAWSPLTVLKDNCRSHGKEELGLFACIFLWSPNLSPQLWGGTVNLLV